METLKSKSSGRKYVAVQQIIYLESENKKIKAVADQEVLQYKNLLAGLEEKERVARATNNRMLMMLDGFKEDDQVDTD